MVGRVARRRLLGWLMAGLGSAFLSLIGYVLIVVAAITPILVVVVIVGSAVKDVTCLVSGMCSSAPSSSDGAYDTNAVRAVTEVFLRQEKAAVARDCARGGSTFCVGVPFVQAIMMAESGGYPLAYSSAGAEGLMQVEPAHFRPGQNAFSPATNIDVGVAYLDSLDRTFGGNLALVAAGYNAGPGVPEEWEREYGTSSWSVLDASPAVEAFSGGQTWNYVIEVLAYYDRFSAPSMPAPGGLSRLG